MKGLTLEGSSVVLALLVVGASVVVVVVVLSFFLFFFFFLVVCSVFSVVASLSSSSCRDSGFLGGDPEGLGSIGVTHGQARGARGAGVRVTDSPWGHREAEARDGRVPRGRLARLGALLHAAAHVGGGALDLLQHGVAHQAGQRVDALAGT